MRFFSKWFFKKDYENYNQLTDFGTSYNMDRYEGRNRNARSFYKTVALVLVCCILTSLLVGGGLYLKFSNDIKELTMMSANQAKVDTFIRNRISGNENTLKLTADNSSTVTSIAKKVGLPLLVLG